MYGPFCVELRISIPTPLFSPSKRSSSAEKKNSEESEEDELEERNDEPSVFSLKYVEGSLIRFFKVFLGKVGVLAFEWGTYFANPVPINIKCSLNFYVLLRTNQHSKKCKCSIEFSSQFSFHNEIFAKNVYLFIFKL